MNTKKLLSSLSCRSMLILFIAFVTLIAIGCSPDNENPPSDNLGAYNTKTIQHEDIERTFHVYLPTNFNKDNPTPMVLALHGGSGSGKRFERDVSDGTLTIAADSRGVILVMPEGIDKRWNDGRPEIFNGDRMYDDVGFISVIIDEMIQNYGVNANKVYVTGISNGGLMSVRLALELSNKIAAAAPVTAQITKALESIVPDTPISIMIINGTADPLVPYDGGYIQVPGITENRGEILSTDETIEKFNAFNQCTNPAEIEPSIDNLPRDGTSIEITRYNNCEQRTEVVLVKVVGGGHTWPGGAEYLPPIIVGKVSREINASQLILDFFLSHSK
ncbi:alpha/beta hydrolase family esterase [Aureibaculum conchae]|uniref:alpha/beta hydrolase family esterase n=1 Tax=Aureibaculum sp. 2308TA14-22 TaxID=3108392 RepID=UPI0033968A40